MTKEEFFETVINNPVKGDGAVAHLKHLYDNNNAKSLFTLAGIDFSELFKGKEDTSGIQIRKPQRII